jgi:hypothetical protein
MRTTIELPDPLFRRVKSTAAARGQSLRDFVTEALKEKLASRGSVAVEEIEGLGGFGKLRRLHRETTRIQAEIDSTFGVVEPEDRT